MIVAQHGQFTHIEAAEAGPPAAARYRSSPHIDFHGYIAILYDKGSCVITFALQFDACLLVTYAASTSTVGVGCQKRPRNIGDYDVYGRMRWSPTHMPQCIVIHGAGVGCRRRLSPLPASAAYHSNKFREKHYRLQQRHLSPFHHGHRLDYADTIDIQPAERSQRKPALFVV